ncbi:menaquinone biosynthesis decarboxylase [Deinococcus roseus]|uniref:Menaquinone biosynthesis decarboxylase n=1 Tax=Deinococcus roseus TaxID=392414 RepID=A0ABQ2D057_9DEIO|nr:menaquinone biosynthesis decarboxylase [Deinococcus roseus]GGJ37934.1 menaquinone biosynthesis decarboxylase [Deinococcus roseus]
MAFNDLQSFIALLESKGQLIRVKREVDRNLEITEIADRLVKKDGPAVLFENVKGSPFPLAIGLMGTRERMAWALGANSLDEVADRIKKLLDVKMGGGLLGMASNLGKLKDLASLPPKKVRNAPVQEVIWRGDEVDLSKIPVLHCWPDDGGPFVTFPLVITKDPISGEYNMGMYRMQVMGKNTTGMHWQRHKTGARHLESAAKLGKRLEVAVALGGDPALIYAATAPLPPVPGLNEYSLTGFLRGQNQPVVKGITVDLDVPANAEFILEGYVDPAEAWIDEGPFGDHTGFYTPVDKYPLFHVTAITMRKNPIYPATIVGRPIMEDAYLIEASERIFLTAAQLIVPEIKDYNMPPAGVAHNLVFVAMKKTYPGQAYKVANGLFGLGQMMFAKVIVVLDEDVPVTDFDRVWREVALKSVPGPHTLHGRGPIDVLDHSSRQWSYGGKLILDATTKHPEEKVQDDFKPLPVKDLPVLEGMLDQWQTPDGYWVVKVHKTRAHQGRELGEALIQHTAASGIRHVLLVDEQTDVRDLQDVWWTILNNIDPERDVKVLSGKMFWDGTPKREDEGFHRVWPQKITMTAEVKKHVSAHWKDYGLPEL